MKIKSITMNVLVNLDEIQEVRKNNKEDSRTDMEIAKILAVHCVLDTELPFVSYLINYTSTEYLSENQLMVIVGVQNSHA